MGAWIQATNDGVIVVVKVCPRAGKTDVAGLDPEWIRIRIQAPPVDGKANAELIAYFSKRFDLPKRAVEILTGETGRLKRVRLYGVNAEQCRTILAGGL
jgi:uncharacterized protein (TIGR00251 family)